MTITNSYAFGVATPQVHTTSAESIENVRSAYNQLERDRLVIMLVGYTTLTSPFVTQSIQRKNMIMKTDIWDMSVVHTSDISGVGVRFRKLFHNPSLRMRMRVMPSCGFWQSKSEVKNASTCPRDTLLIYTKNLVWIVWSYTHVLIRFFCSATKKCKAMLISNLKFFYMLYLYPT